MKRYKLLLRLALVHLFVAELEVDVRVTLTGEGRDRSASSSSLRADPSVGRRTFPFRSPALRPSPETSSTRRVPMLFADSRGASWMSTGTNFV
jgi:hypothetical protein